MKPAYLIPTWTIAILTSLMPARASAQDANTYKLDRGGYRVQAVTMVWKDGSRNHRDVPVKVYYPLPVESRDPKLNLNATDKDGKPLTKFPLVVFSHGLGGTRDGYEYIGEHLASHGYIVVHPQHLGSDAAAMRDLARNKKDDTDTPGAKREERRLGRLGQMVSDGTSDPDNLVNRPLDVSFVITQMEASDRFSKLVDPARIAVAGHSFGAYTSMAAGGMLVNLPADKGGADHSFRDDRVKAIIAMSPQGPGMMGIDDDAWRNIKIPAMILTGSKDMGQGDRAVSWRLKPFEKLSSPDTYLVYITDATHMTFGGATAPLRAVRGGPADVVERHLGYVKQACVAFLDAYLLEKPEALQWLHDQKLTQASAKECELTWKGSRSADRK